MSEITKWDEWGPLLAFLQDPNTSEIMVNGANRVFVEQKGVLKKTPIKFSSDAALVDLMKRIASFTNRILDEDHPFVDCRLPDGSRVNCVLPPLAIDGPALTIRKFSQSVLTPQDLLAKGTFDENIAYFLSLCVQARINIVISGGTGSGKTTLLNVLSSFLNPHERVITIEDAAELKLHCENLVRMETRKAQEGSPAIAARDLVINALRMRPDRILIGECRGAEAYDMLVAMNTGHEGSMTTLHANSAREALRRLETMLAMSGVELPIRVLRQHIANSLECIIQVSRCSDGVRRVVEILEVSHAMEGDTLLTQEIYRWTPDKGFKSSGLVPSFVKKFHEAGLNYPKDFFSDAYSIKTSAPKKKM